MRLLIADLVTELEPRYENTKRLAEPFRYEGDRPTDIRLTVTDAYLESLMRRAAPNTTEELMENFAFSCDFNRKAIPFQTMLVHSSALVYDGGAYLFSADSGVGKSTHTRLWLQAFGERPCRCARSSLWNGVSKTPSASRPRARCCKKSIFRPRTWSAPKQPTACSKILKGCWRCQNSTC